MSNGIGTATATAAPNPYQASSFFAGTYIITYHDHTTAQVTVTSSQGAANQLWQIRQIISSAVNLQQYPSGSINNVPIGLRLVSISL